MMKTEKYIARSKPIAARMLGGEMTIGSVSGKEAGEEDANYAQS
jgi:hypothetical protein